MKGTFTVRGHKVRTQSHFRFQLVRTHPGEARIIGRTDSLASARERRAKASGIVVILDSVTGQEIG